MRRLSRLAAVIAIVVGITPGGGFAGVADSPLPVLPGGGNTLHLYSVPGLNHFGGIETLFSCTSMERTATIQVGVEVFGSLGALGPRNDAAATSLTFGPGDTKVFATGPAVGFSVQSDLGAGTVINGSARILATSKNVACSAFLADAINAPPTSMVQLTIIRKTKQKAAN